MVPFSCSPEEFVSLVGSLTSYFEMINYDQSVISRTRMRFLGCSGSGDLRFEFITDCSHVVLDGLKGQTKQFVLDGLKGQTKQ